MKKAEIRTQKTETLIIHLCGMMTSAAVFKKDIKEAQWISEELKSRGVIDDEESFFEEWYHRYRL